MNKKNITTFKFLFSCFFVIFLIWKSEPKLILKLITSCNFIYLYISIFLFLFIVIIGVYRWKLLLSQVLIKSSFSELTKLILLSQFGNVFIPGGFWGDLMRGLKLKKKSSTSKGIASVFIDRVLGIFGFIFLGFIMLPFASQFLKRSLFIFLLIIFSSIIVLVFLVFYYGKFQQLIINILSSKRKIIKKLKQFYLDVIFQANNNNVTIFKAFIISLIANFINIFVFYFISKALGNSVSLIYFFLFIPIIIVISRIPISFQGLGLREAGFIVLFAKSGLTRSQSLSISLLYFTIILTVALLSGIIYFIWNHFGEESTTI